MPHAAMKRSARSISDAIDWYRWPSRLDATNSWFHAATRERSANPPLVNARTRFSVDAGLVVRLHEPLCVGGACGGRGRDVVDHVPAERRQVDARRCARWAPTSAWRTGPRCGPPSRPGLPRSRSARPPSGGRRAASRGCSPPRSRRTTRRSHRPGAGRPGPRRRRRGPRSGPALRPRRRAEETRGSASAPGRAPPRRASRAVGRPGARARTTATSAQSARSKRGRSGSVPRNAVGEVRGAIGCDDAGRRMARRPSAWGVCARRRAMTPA